MILHILKIFLKILKNLFYFISDSKVIKTHSHILFLFQILKTLKHIPIPNKNELDDSKVVHVVSKWSKKLITQEANQSEEQQSGSENELKIDEYTQSPLNDPSEDTSNSSANEKLNKVADTESTEEGIFMKEK